MGYGGSQRSIKIPKENIAPAKGRPFGYWRIPPPKGNGDRSPRRDHLRPSPYRCFNLRPYQPTVKIIKSIIEIFAHSLSVGIGAGDGTAVTVILKVVVCAW